MVQSLIVELHWSILKCLQTHISISLCKLQDTFIELLHCGFLLHQQTEDKRVTFQLQKPGGIRRIRFSPKFIGNWTYLHISVATFRPVSIVLWIQKLTSSFCRLFEIYHVWKWHIIWVVGKARCRKYSWISFLFCWSFSTNCKMKLVCADLLPLQIESSSVRNTEVRPNSPHSCVFWDYHTNIIY